MNEVILFQFYTKKIKKVNPKVLSRFVSLSFTAFPRPASVGHQQETDAFSRHPFTCCGPNKALLQITLRARPMQRYLPRVRYVGKGRHESNIYRSNYVYFRTIYIDVI